MQKYRENSPLEVSNHLADDIEEEELDLESNSLNVDVLLGFIHELPDRYRLVFNLYALDNYSHKEIAALLKITEGTSKSNLFRARKILKDKLIKHQQNDKKFHS